MFTLKIELLFGIYANESWQCEIEIPCDYTLHDLHLVIQSVLRFDSKHLYEFYIASEKASRDRIRFDDDGATHQKKISELFPLEKGKNLFYFFDYRDCWLFKVSNKKLSSSSEAYLKYPRCISETGEKPNQYLRTTKEVA